jgi:hypothetical protein
MTSVLLISTGSQYDSTIWAELRGWLAQDPRISYLGAGAVADKIWHARKPTPGRVRIRIPSRLLGRCVNSQIFVGFAWLSRNDLRVNINATSSWVLQAPDDKSSGPGTSFGIVYSPTSGKGGTQAG